MASSNFATIDLMSIQRDVNQVSSSLGEHDLARAIAKGDKKALKLLYSKYSGLFFTIAKRYAGNSQEAEDLVQEAFVLIYRKAHTFNFKGSFEGWMKRVVVNKCLTHVKKNQITTDTSIDELTHYEGLSVDSWSLERMNVDEILNAFKLLPSGARLVLNLFVIDGFNHKEIARELGITESASRSQLTKARFRLRKILEEKELIERRIDKKENRFDASLRNKLGDHKSELKRNLWDDIAAEIDDGNGKRFGAWRWITGILLFVSVIGVLFSQRHSPVYIPRTAGTSLDSGMEKEPLVTGRSDDNQTLVDQNKAIVQISTTDRVSFSSQNQDLSENTTEIDIEKPSFQREPYGLEDDVIVNHHEIRSDDNSVQQSAVIEVSEPPSENSSDQIGEEDVRPREVENFEIDEIHNSDIDFSVEALNYIPDSVSFEEVLAIEDSIILVTEESPDSLIVEESAMSDSLLIPLDILESNRKWSIELLAGPAINYRTFSSDSNPELSSHRNDNDKVLLSGNFALMIKRALGERLSMAVGIASLNTGENYSFTLNNETHNFKNTYQFVSIPLEVDYQFRPKRDFGISLGLGAQWNLLKDGTSSWVDLNSFQPITHNNKGPLSPFTEEVLAWNMSITGKYNLSPRIDLIIRERATILGGSIYKKETGLNQRSYAFNTLVGLGVKF